MEDILNYEKKQEEDYYSLLGCDPSSTVEQILTEYRVLALKLHPDKNPDDADAESRFQLLQTAKETLCNEEKRAKYDKWRASGISVSFEQWSNLNSHMTTTLHWANPQTKDRMLGPGSSQPSQGGEEAPRQQRRSSDFMPSRTTTEAWESDKSEVLRKFRNYEI